MKADASCRSGFIREFRGRSRSYKTNVSHAQHGPGLNTGAAFVITVSKDNL